MKMLTIKKIILINIFNCIALSGTYPEGNSSNTTVSFQYYLRLPKFINYAIHATNNPLKTRIIFTAKDTTVGTEDDANYAIKSCFSNYNDIELVTYGNKKHRYLFVDTEDKEKSDSLLIFFDRIAKIQLRRILPEKHSSRPEVQSFVDKIATKLDEYGLPVYKFSTNQYITEAQKNELNKQAPQVDNTCNLI